MSNQECCKVCDALQTAIIRIDDELTKIREGTTEMPPTFGTKNIDVWLQLQEGRHDYLEGIRSNFDFLLNNKERSKLQI